MVTVELAITGGIEQPLSYVVIAARYSDGWLFVKHRRRGGYELPAGHPGEGEGSVEAAVRELTEETGALDFTLEPVTYYSVGAGRGRQYGRLFYADIGTLGELTDTDEIEGVKVFRRLPRNLSLPEVMSFLFRVAKEYARGL
ncbi:MAG: NUDIX domain-containing protein [Bacteroidales bacterium]|jgi:8-oxo-dGTP diphosphatase|nr:NUDIX domain-containing protein [Bacteroidales bacterium]